MVFLNRLLHLFRGLLSLFFLSFCLLCYSIDIMYQVQIVVLRQYAFLHRCPQLTEFLYQLTLLNAVFCNIHNCEHFSYLNLGNYIVEFSAHSWITRMLTHSLTHHIAGSVSYFFSILISVNKWYGSRIFFSYCCYLLSESIFFL